jgi:hypothetical protein
LEKEALSILHYRNDISFHIGGIKLMDKLEGYDKISVAGSEVQLSGSMFRESVQRLVKLKAQKKNAKYLN